MLVKWFCYDINSGDIILMLPDVPDNTNFDDVRGDVIFNGTKYLGGVNWDNVDWEYNSSGVELDDMHNWNFNSTTSDLTDLGEIINE